MAIPHPKNGPELKLNTYNNNHKFMFYVSINESCPEFLCRLTHATFLEAAVFPYDQQDAGRELVDEKLINGDKRSWPVLVGLLDSFGVRNISTGTLGASPPMDLRVVCGDFIASILDSGTGHHGQLATGN